MLVNYIHKHYEYMLNTMLSFGLAIEPTHIKYIGKYTMINNVTYSRKTIIINKACHIFEEKKHFQANFKCRHSRTRMTYWPMAASGIFSLAVLDSLFNNTTKQQSTHMDNSLQLHSSICKPPMEVQYSQWHSTLTLLRNNNHRWIHITIQFYVYVFIQNMPVLRFFK